MQGPQHCPGHCQGPGILPHPQYPAPGPQVAVSLVLVCCGRAEITGIALLLPSILHQFQANFALLDADFKAAMYMGQNIYAACQRREDSVHILNHNLGGLVSQQ